MAMESDLEHAFLPFKVRQSPTNPRAPRLPIDQWRKYRQVIEDLYVQQGKTLGNVVNIMKQEHDFHAT